MMIGVGNKGIRLTRPLWFWFCSPHISRGHGCNGHPALKSQEAVLAVEGRWGVGGTEVLPKWRHQDRARFNLTSELA